MAVQQLLKIEAQERINPLNGLGREIKLRYFDNKYDNYANSLLSFLDKK
jgi:hypothetical protein